MTPDRRFKAIFRESPFRNSCMKSAGTTLPLDEAQRRLLLPLWEQRNCATQTISAIENCLHLEPHLLIAVSTVPPTIGKLTSPNKSRSLNNWHGYKRLFGSFLLSLIILTVPVRLLPSKWELFRIIIIIITLLNQLGTIRKFSRSTEKSVPRTQKTRHSAVSKASESFLYLP
jgi:hypothetical protein